MPDDINREAIGGNNPPNDIDILRERLAEEAAQLTSRRDELLGSVDRAPLVVVTEEEAGKVADLIKMITACHKNAEIARVARKEPFLASGRAVDGFYKQITDPLEKAKGKVALRLTAYQRAKEAEERRRREEEARLQAEEAERQRQAAAAAAQAMQTSAQLDAAIAAERHAKQVAADAEKARQAAAAKPAELSRTRGDFGAVASLRTEWTGELISRDEIDLEALRPHVNTVEIEKAIRSFVRVGGRQLRGARIYERQISVVS